MKALIKVFYLSFLAITVLACQPASGQKNQKSEPVNQAFRDYWYGGTAELNRYELEQARYGEIHPGEAVLIFVTEDFWTDKQVKYESGNRGNKVKSILKLNHTKKFFTGLYPYSLMTSVFTPVDNQPTLKVSTSVQEWCGHAFSQLNLQKNKYQGLLRSYFQEEGDREFSLPAALLEDEVWTKIRLNPTTLPTGDISLIPGTQFLRLRHLDYKVASAKASLTTTKDEALSSQPLSQYRIAYQDIQRTLTITFTTEFPHEILAWEEEQLSGFGQPQTMTTRAVRTNVMKSAYWGQHDLKDAPLRKAFGMDGE